MFNPKASLICLLCLGLPSSGAFSQSFQHVEPDFSAADAVVRGDAVDTEQERWVVKTHLVWNEEADILTRQTYEVWQGPMEAGLTFRWTPASIAQANSGRVTGKGTVFWQDVGAASYDQDAVVSTYVGDMQDGRRHGHGIYRHKSGFSYEGTWQTGKMQGTGYLTFTNGDHYVGGFAQGQLHGGGRLIDSDGTIFEGTFVDGIAQGEGLVRRADDLEYLAVWKDGTEVAGSRNVVYQPEILNAQLSDAFRVGVVLENRGGQADPTSMETPTAAEIYKSRAVGETLRLFPASQRILDVWRGNAPITMNGREIGQRYSGGGFLGIMKENIKPVSLIFEFENKSRSDVRIVSTSIVVESSKTDTEPMLQAYSPLPECGIARPGFDPNFLLENFGWADVENGQLSLQFLDPTGTPVSTPETVNIGTFKTSLFVDLIPIIARKGADVASMERGYQCAPPASFEQDDWEAFERQCIEKAKTVAGELGPALEIFGLGFVTTVAGNLAFQWRDLNGNETRKSKTFKLQVPVGTHTLSLAECGEGGSPPDGSVKVFRLKLDQDNYRLRVPLKDTVPAGVTSRWRLAFEAEKNSDHRFRLKFDLSDGQTVLSRPIELAYLRPRMPQ